MSTFKVTMLAAALVAGAVGIWGADVAQADSARLGEIDMKRAWRPPSETRTWVHLEYGSDHWREVRMGTFGMEVNPSSASGEGLDVVTEAGSDNRIGLFCAELTQSAPSNDYFTTYGVYDPTVPPEGGFANWAFPDGMDSDTALDLKRLHDNYSDDLGSTTNQAAFQLAMWEIIYETASTYNVRDTSSQKGAFYAYLESGSSEYISLANSWLSDLGSADPTRNLRILADSCRQDYAIAIDVPTPPPGVIPEPITMIGLASGIAAAAGYVRKRLRA